MEFTAQVPTNNKDAKIDGYEFAIQHFFGDSGFGIQANYTIVNGDVDFNVAADPTTTQFALVGLSDTANLIAMYENDKFQARIAYNWRDKFLNNAARYVNEPAFTEEYYQVDFNVAYNYSEKLSFFLEGINITEQDNRQHGRYKAQLWNLDKNGALYNLGVRYNF
jgi:TonB-dependent receptor